MATAKLITKKDKTKTSKTKSKKTKSLLPRDIKKIREYDRELFRALFICGHVSEKNLLKLMADKYGTDRTNRIETWLKNGFIQNHSKSKNKGSRVFALTSLGVKLCKKEEGLKFKGSHQSHDSGKIRHNLGLSHKYMQLSQAQRESCRTETTIREEDFKGLIRSLTKEILIKDQELSSLQKGTDEYKQKEDELYTIKLRLDGIECAWESRDISTPDLSYVDETGQEVYYEIVTNYTAKEIAAKVEFSKLMNKDILMQRV